MAGFSLHAGVAAKADERKKLERLCRCISRPAVSEKRPSLSRGGKILYQLKTSYRDGTTHVIFESLDFIARLAALAPKPRVNLTRFHGVSAPNSRHRALVTPAKAWLAVYLSWLPTDIMAFAHGDKMGHAAMFAVLAFACRLSWPYSPMAIPAGALVLLGLVTEALQLWIPGRTGAWGDMAADCAGVVLGMVVAWLLWPGAKNALSMHMRADS